MNDDSVKLLDRIFASKKRQATLTVVLAVLLLIVIAVGVYLYATGGFSAKSKVTAFNLHDIGELATQSGYFREVNVIDDAKKLFSWNIPFTASKYVFSYDGEIKAGIDFAEIEWSADEKSKTVTVHLPAPKILSREIKEDSLEIYDERQSIFTPLTLTDIQESRQELLEELEATAMANGLLEAAGENAKKLIVGFMSGLYNPAEYSYIFE